MWKYADITRDEFEKIKDHVEDIMVAHGAVVQDMDLPYSRKTTTVHRDSNAIVWESHRKVYKYNELYYRIDELCFDEKPYIVAEVGTYDELMKNTMEDADPFPWDLSKEEMENEVSFFLGEKPYPTK
ncbi:MAG: hypothetical protein K5629_04000 [Eubacteriales bacterium]|nr:hypothetical protein [Eubacteriales bacterium]